MNNRRVAVTDQQDNISLFNLNLHILGHNNATVLIWGGARCWMTSFTCITVNTTSRFACMLQLKPSICEMTFLNSLLISVISKAILLILTLIAPIMMNLSAFARCFCQSFPWFYWPSLYLVLTIPRNTCATITLIFPYRYNLHTLHPKIYRSSFMSCQQTSNIDFMTAAVDWTSWSRQKLLMLHVTCRLF